MGTKPQGVGPATVNEFRAAVQKFRQAGKTAILFAETIGSLEKYVHRHSFASPDLVILQLQHDVSRPQRFGCVLVRHVL